MIPHRTTSRFRRLAAFLLGRDTPETAAREAELKHAMDHLDLTVVSSSLLQQQAEQTLAKLLPPRQNGASHAEGATS